MRSVGIEPAARPPAPRVRAPNAQRGVDGFHLVKLARPSTIDTA
jgi:hypothetical protein